MYYYLETNAIYNLKKYPISMLPFSFTSAFAVMELVTGIVDQNSFEYRKGVLAQIGQKRLQVVWQLPERFIFETFDLFKEDEFKDDRPGALKTLVDELMISEDYQAFTVTTAYQSELGYQFFKDLDDRLSKGFIMASQLGNEEFKKSLQSAPADNTIVFEGETFVLDSAKAVMNFYTRFPDLNRMYSVEALVTLAQNWLNKPNTDPDAIFFSYNQSINVFVEVLSFYCITKQAQKNLPARNDFADLIHVLYLKDHDNVRLISDDKIYQVFMPARMFTMSALRIKKSYLSGKHEGLQPIRVLQHNITYNFENTHPEFIEEMKKLISKAGLKPGITYYIYEEAIRHTTKYFKSQMPHVTSKKKIALHETFLSYMWIICYSVWILYDEAVAKPIQKQQSGPGINVIDEEAIRSAQELLDYGKSLIGKYLPWEKARLPNPEEYSIAEDFYITRANSLFGFAINFILCHEYAHVEKRHHDQAALANSQQRKQFEREADNRAIELTLKGRNGENDKSVELGILMGLSALLFLKSNTTGGPHHPDTDWRIKNYLNQLNPTNESPIWGIATLFFKLWDQEFGNKFTWPTEINDFKELVNLTLAQIKQP
jgi:hypothetical protein